MPEIVLASEIVPEIDWENPLVAEMGVIAAFICDGTNVVEVVSGTVSGSTPTVNSDSNGNNWKGVAQFLLADVGIDLANTNYNTFQMIGSFNTRTNGESGEDLRFLVNSSESTSDFQIKSDGRWSSTYPLAKSNYNSYSMSNMSIISNTFTSVAFSVRQAGDRLPLRGYHNGIEAQVNSSCHSSDASIRNYVQLGDWSSTLTIVYVYDNIPSNENLDSIEANPYQLFKLIDSGVEQTFVIAKPRWYQNISPSIVETKQLLRSALIEQTIEIDKNQVLLDQVYSTEDIEQTIYASTARINQEQNYDTQLIEQHIAINTLSVNFEQQFTTTAIEQVTFIETVPLNAEAVYTVNPIEQFTHISRANIKIDSVLTCEPISYSFDIRNIEVGIEQIFTVHNLGYVTQILQSNINQDFNVSTTPVEQVFLISATQLYVGALPTIGYIDWENVVLYSTTSQYRMISTTPQYILTRE
jgi:hypothetical protein